MVIVNGENNYGDRFRPREGSGWSSCNWPNFMAYKWGVILTTYKSWDDPPSSITLIHTMTVLMEGILL